MKRRWVMVILGVLAAGLVCGVSVVVSADSGGAVLSAPGDIGRAGGGAELPSPGSRGTVLSFALCMKSAGPIEVTRVTPQDKGTGLIISGFAVVHTKGRSDVEGWTPQPLEKSWAADGPRTVDVSCHQTKEVDYPVLVLEVTAPSRRVSVFRGLNIFYNGGNKPLQMPFDMRICQIPLDAPACSSAR